MINTNFKGSVPGRCFFIYVRTFNWLPVACMLSSLNHCFVNNVTVIVLQTGDTKQSRLESIMSTTEITQNKHVKVLHYFVDDIKLLK